jgi:hypothetical protein
MGRGNCKHTDRKRNKAEIEGQKARQTENVEHTDNYGKKVEHNARGIQTWCNYEPLGTHSSKKSWGSSSSKKPSTIVLGFMAPSPDMRIICCRPSRTE